MLFREGFEDFDDPEERRTSKYAKRKHDDTGARRKASGLPYYVHPEGVAKILKSYGASKEEILAAFCHDLLEEAGVTVEDIEDRFGSAVAEIVSEVTSDKRDMANYKEKEDYLNQKLRFMSSPAFTVKLGDNLFNVLDSPKPGQAERIRRNVAYAMKHRKLNSVQKSLATAIL